MSTKTSLFLAIGGPLVFILVPFLQFGIFSLYNKFGHPWSRILNPDQGDFGESPRRRRHQRTDSVLRYFSEFWQHVEQMMSQEIESRL